MYDPGTGTKLFWSISHAKGNLYFFSSLVLSPGLGAGNMPWHDEYRNWAKSTLLGEERGHRSGADKLLVDFWIPRIPRRKFR